MNEKSKQRLPIHDVIPELFDAMATAQAAVLIAPPGAGKTTCVPLALRDEDWLKENKIILLEPRRIAARTAAQRMAHMLGESVGETVGLRARFDTKIGAKTQIEVVTEGVFTRMILSDPSLEGIGAVIFDEFHERSLDADFGLALCLDAMAGYREDLRVLVMSATLAGSRVAQLLGHAPVIESAGRMHPVTTRYLGRSQNARIEVQTADAIELALRNEPGSILVFLPGQGEIRRTARELEERLDAREDVMICPLYGALTPAEQDRAIQPPAHGLRKVVLGTSIAETSLTIEGVRVIIDSGLARVPRYEPGAGITRLETVRASRASVDQRQGRAGRTEPGVCYRLWNEPQTRALPEFSEPEIVAADLNGLLLDCADWGVTDPHELKWLDPPPQAALDAARQDLTSIGALDNVGHITPVGRALREIPLPPRLAAMVITGAHHSSDAAHTAAQIAALLVERDMGGTDADLRDRLARFRNDRSKRSRQMLRLSEGWAKSALKAAKNTGPSRNTSRTDGSNLHSLAAHSAAAYPDRIAKQRGEKGQYLLASGRGANIDATHALAKEPFLVVAELQGKAAATRILSAAPLSEQELYKIAGDRVVRSQVIEYDAEARALRQREVTKLDAITLNSKPMRLDAQDSEHCANILAEGLAATGVDKLPWSRAQQQLRHRIRFLRTAGQDELPDVSDEALAATAPDWLAPFLTGKTKADQVSANDLQQALSMLLPHHLLSEIDSAAPTHFVAPTGHKHPIDYDGPGAPALNIRVQELFGLKTHPTIANGKLPLTLNLMSPANRPIQITRDLPGFWQGSWASVKADMKGRYPKHPWPDDPANAAPTRRAKPRKP
ncbi:MAG: ATP-dependent helicase HrpB [Filomicrobium sp.]